MTDRDSRWGLLRKTLPMLIDGEEVIGEGSSSIVSPSTKSTVGAYATAGVEDIERAVAAARRAQPRWAALPARDRAKVLREMATIVERHQLELEFLDAVDIGKPVMNVRFSDIPVSLDALAYFAGRAMDVRGASVEVGDPLVTHREVLEPWGTVLEILPWNGPLWTGVQRIAAILASGNACIVKPAEIASASFLHFARLVNQVVPKGILQVLPGSGGTVGNALAVHRGVDMVSLTGGVATGVRVLQDLAAQLKPVSLELGGKNPNIVLDDADLESALEWSTMGAFANSGQVCVCGSRILVQRGVYEEFAAGLAARAKERVVGDPLHEATQMGPVVGKHHFEAIWRYLDTAIEGGDGSVIAGGERYSDGPLSEGWFIPPTVIRDVAPSCTIAREEVFGPVVTLTPIEDLDEGLAIANDTSYGLAAGIFTSNVDSAERAARALQSGQVYVNQWFAPGGMQAPSNGYKHSGYGMVGMEKYQQRKQVFLRTSGGQ